MGNINADWIASRYEDSTPWFEPRKYVGKDFHTALDMEIHDFYNYVKPRWYEDDIRSSLIVRIENAIQKRYPGCQIHCFGSFACGLNLPGSDMDLVLVSSDYARDRDEFMKNFRSRGQLTKVLDYLENAGIAIRRDRNRSAESIIHKARVPIIKFVSRDTGLKVDISFENFSGVDAIPNFTNWKEQYPDMPILVSLIKQFVLMRGWNEVFTGGIGGYTVTCLVTSIFQHLYAAPEATNNNLGSVLMSFLDLYGRRAETWRDNRIQMEPPAILAKVILATLSAVMVLIADRNLSIATTDQ
jgi:non-canonical poly(A) RNA polymerase PAPD5/7